MTTHADILAMRERIASRIADRMFASQHPGPPYPYSEATMEALRQNPSMFVDEDLSPEWRAKFMPDGREPFVTSEEFMQILEETRQ